MENIIANNILILKYPAINVKMINIYYNQSSVSNNVQKIIFKTLKLKHVMSHQVKNISKM